VVAVGYQNQQGLLYDYKYPRFWLDTTSLSISKCDYHRSKVHIRL